MKKIIPYLLVLVALIVATRFLINNESEREGERRKYEQASQAQEERTRLIQKATADLRKSMEEQEKRREELKAQQQKINELLKPLNKDD